MNVLRTIENDLKSTGLPWEIATGKKHLKVRLDGRMVGILPKCGKDREGDPRALKNVRAQIRRAARALG